MTIEDRTPLSVGGEEIEAVTEFPYLWSQMESSGRMTLDVEKRVAQASKAFRALRKPVLSDNDLNTVTKRKVYLCPPVRIRVLDTVEKYLKKLDSFHNRCVRTVLGVSNREQWSQRITSAELRRRWGDTETATVKVMKCRLEWLGHVAKMPENRTPKICLFSWLTQPRPRGGPRLRWRDVVRRDLRAMNVSEERWYDEATVSRARWRNTCREGLKNLTTVIGDQETQDYPANQIN